ncbi:MAG TPA: glycoside hydrolase family 44 protein [Verrucomicrobiota bacterium]|nr:glycoside hydrolase family 44 protein [Verrucomicrobiota bacterium]HPU56620.1 glycoside hydrolase family 44 protein [Verrucomicrobiota bacterium]
MHLSFRTIRRTWSSVLAGILIVHAAGAQTDQPVYTDFLHAGWQDWSWAIVNFGKTSPVYSGSASISVSASSYEALYLHHAPQPGSLFSHLSFRIHGGTVGGQTIQVQATRNGMPQTPVILDPLPAGSWRLEEIPLSALGVADADDFDGFWLQLSDAIPAPTFYVDDIRLIGADSPEPTNEPVNVVVDAARNRRPISPLIYGVAFASSNELALLQAPLNRSGGNAETRYNWELNARNHAADWYFESLPAGPAIPGGAADDHVSKSKAAGSEPILTVPMIGWMPKLGPNREKLASYSIAKYGPQTDNDWQWFPDAGNGIGTNPVTQTSWLITTNDPYDAHFLTNSDFQQAWIHHLTNRWGLSTNGGVRYYCMDNEHTLWNSTHRDVHSVGTTMQEIRDKFFDYGGKVKDVDPGALLLAPEEWGWTGYFYSGFDAAWAAEHNDWNPAHFPDRAANGGWDYMPWLLDQARQHEIDTGRRLLDVFTLHFYPQGGEFSDDTSTAMQLRRNRSTRALWDTNYVDETWINSVVKLIPRMREWVETHYPGTKIGITEYNWGAENHINGATAQADILGIFGREGLDLATRWTTPEPGTPTFKAMQMYRNYDGNGSAFGDVSVFAGGPDPDNVSVFAALRSGNGALTLMAINKQLSITSPLAVTLTNWTPGGTAQVWRLTSANAITRLADVTFSGNAFTNALPPQSITLFVIAPGQPPVLREPALTNGVFRFLLEGRPGQKYVIESSGNLANWTPVGTNQLSGNSILVEVAPVESVRFYRAMQAP